MKLTYYRSGGFVPAPRRTRVIETDALSAEDAESLNCLLEAAEFFELPARNFSRGGADCRSYTLRVDDGQRVREVQFDDGTMTEPLAQLIDALEDLDAEMGA